MPWNPAFPVSLIECCLLHCSWESSRNMGSLVSCWINASQSVFLSWLLLGDVCEWFSISLPLPHKHTFKSVYHHHPFWSASADVTQDVCDRVDFRCQPWWLSIAITFSLVHAASWGKSVLTELWLPITAGVRSKWENQKVVKDNQPLVNVGAFGVFKAKQ